jgi:DNA-binding GntR family transcriptional regulator
MNGTRCNSAFSRSGRERQRPQARRFAHSLSTKMQPIGCYNRLKHAPERQRQATDPMSFTSIAASGPAGPALAQRASQRHDNVVSASHGFSARSAAQELKIAVELAIVRQQLQPGAQLSLAALAGQFQAGQDLVLAVVGLLARGGLVTFDGETVGIPAFDHADLHPLLAERALVDARLVGSVVGLLSEEKCREIVRLIRHAHMAARVGDLEIMVKNDSAVDDVIRDHAPDPDLALRSHVLKTLIRRIWLREKPYADLVPLMDTRRRMVEAMAAGDAQASAHHAIAVVEAVRGLLSRPG